MFKKFLLLFVAFSLITSLEPVEPGYQATLSIRRENSATPAKSDVFHLKPISYASIYPAADKQIVKIIRAVGNEEGCRPFQQINPDSNKNYAVFYLVNGKDGLCTFNKRVKNAKKSSANGIIIVNYKQALSNFNIFSSKDYFQVFLLSEGQGPLILAQKSPFLAQISMKKAKDSAISTAELWISSLNQKSYEIVSWWAANLKNIPDLYKKVIWQPRFAYISCKIAQKNNTCGGNTDSCACGGIFCSPEKHGKSSNVLVREDIRQQLIYTDHGDKFLIYMIQFKQQCLKAYVQTGFVQDCANSLLNHLQIDETALNQKIDKFLSNCQNINLAVDTDFANELLIYSKMILDQGKYRHINTYPTITLNHEILSIKNEKQLKDELCRKLGMEKEQGCFVQQQTKITQYNSAWSTLLWTVLIILLVVAAIFVILKFRNKLRHEMNKELKMQVSTAVEHYFTLAETNASK